MTPNAPQIPQAMPLAAPEPTRFPHIICGFLLRRVTNATASTAIFLWKHMAACRDKQLRRSSSAAPAMAFFTSPPSAAAEFMDNHHRLAGC